MNRSPIANRSFLHGNRKSNNTSSDKLVYATLDSLALKRARLPLQLLPTKIKPDNAANTLEQDAKCTTSLSNNLEETSLTACTIESHEIENSIYSKVLCTRQGNTDQTLRTDNEKKTMTCCSFELYEKVEASSMLEASAAAVSIFPKKKRKKHFAKNVFRAYFSQRHFVKRAKKKRRRRERQDSSGPSPDSTIRKDSKAKKALLSESLYMSISSPTNFVHVASATVPNLADSLESAISWPALDKVVITYEEKCATLPPPSRRNEARIDLSESGGNRLKDNYAKLLRSKSSVFDCGKSVGFVNHSFLWSRPRSKSRLSVGESAGASSRTDNEPDSTKEQYDDVLPTPISVPEVYTYDDVGLPRAKLLNNDADDSIDETYDDVIVTHPVIKRTSSEDSDDLAAKSQRNSLLENEYSSVEEANKDDEQPLYDDVGFPKAAEERVNSLYYSGSSTELYSTSNRESSEWEDIDEESALGPAVSSASLKKNLWKTSEQFQRGPSKKRFGQAPRRPCKSATRHRSKRPWRSFQSFQKNTLDTREFHVAVSLGCGSVLLVGKKANEERKNDRRTSKTAETDDSVKESYGEKVGGLIDVRMIEHRGEAEIQEMSCFVIDEDDASDGSNYESLCSLQSEKESSEAELELTKNRTEKRSLEVNSRGRVSPFERRQAPEELEAPTKPVPAPPRESSLTETLGKRIKMLRRTWSITKGSIGRIRRRTSIQVENGCDDGKYFGLARHFRKSAPTLQSSNANSRFYLDERGAPAPDTTTTSHEPLYANWSHYENTDAGIRPTSTASSEMILDNIDHYSVFSDQEPLYQFYAAAAARFAYDSPSEVGENDFELDNNDSDGYEEVRRVIPSKATTELAKPGHRTLWSQTPEIINSGLLQSLTQDEIKIQEGKFEILTSEASYLNSLRVLEKEFLGDFVLTQQILSPVEREKLFGSVPYVLQTSEKFLAALESVWRSDPMLRALPDTLLNHAHTYSDAYIAYCSKQVTIDASFKDLRARKGSKLQDALARIEARPSCQSLGLHSFLMLPMQRITRLPLLADAILSKLPMDQTAEKRSWENVLSTFSHIVAECNEAARNAAQEAEIEQLTRQLEYPTKIAPIPLKGKSLIKSGQVVQLLSKLDGEYKLTFGKKFNKLPLFLFLLTDCLLVTKRKTNTAQEEAYLVIDVCKRNLVALERAPEDGVIAGAKNAMLLTVLENYCGQQMNYLLTCETNTERERWLEAVCPCEQGLIGETLYEAWDCPQVVALYSYSPCQPDELLLQPGDVINVLKKMPDGWNQGEKLLSGEQGWFPGNYTKEVASEHVRARNLKQRHRLFTLSGSTNFQRSGK